MTIGDFKKFFEEVNPPDNAEVYIDEGAAFGKYLIDSLNFKNGKMIILESYEQVIEKDQNLDDDRVRTFEDCARVEQDIMLRLNSVNPFQ